jgi:hypothetical protein
MSSRTYFEEQRGYIELREASGAAAGQPAEPLSSTLAEMLSRAANGDLSAAAQVLSYLTAGLYDLRQIMILAVHSSGSARLWRCLLDYLSVGEWGEWDPFGDGQETRQHRLSWKEPRTGAAADAIIDLFVIDESEAEATQKGLVLHRALHGPQPIRYAAACLLGMRGDTASIAILEDMICGGGNPNAAANEAWQIHAVRALGALGDARGGSALLCALTGPSKPLHQAAARALRQLGDQAEDILQLALLHPDSHIRWHAARSLGQIGNLHGIDTLVDGLRDEHQAVRWATAATLANLDLPAVPHILREIIKHPIDERFRQAVYHALHAMPSNAAKEALNPLLTALRDPTAAYEAPIIAQHMLAKMTR